MDTTQELTEDEMDLEAELSRWTENLRRKEQDLIDRIMHGQEPGHYFVLLGPKVRTFDCLSVHGQVTNDDSAVTVYRFFDVGH